MAKSEKTPFPQSKKLKKADGTIAYVWDNKLHNWEGPALIPEGKEKLGEYKFVNQTSNLQSFNNFNFIFSGFSDKMSIYLGSSKFIY